MNLPTNLSVTENPDPISEAQVVEGIREYNRKFMPDDIRPLCAFDHAESGELVSGVIARTFWNYLDIKYLWVSEKYQNQGRATALLKAVEEEAIERGCSGAFLDTFSFQALGLYEKLGYEEFGQLSGFAGDHNRHYLYKLLI